MESNTAMEPMWALLACFRWTSQFQVDRLAGESCWDLIAERLQKGTADCVTISTLGSADTIPLGTDLDPHNGYCNLWAAGKVHDPNARRLDPLPIPCPAQGPPPERLCRYVHSRTCDSILGMSYAHYPLTYQALSRSPFHPCMYRAR